MKEIMVILTKKKKKKSQTLKQIVSLLFLLMYKTKISIDFSGFS